MAFQKKPFWLQPESRRLELKEEFPTKMQVAKTAIAFANGPGGRIVIGVRDDPREIIGVPDDEIFTLEEKLVRHISDNCAPIIIPEIYVQNVEGKSLLVVEIFPGHGKPYYLKSKGKRKGTFFRIGSSNQRASLDMIEELERRRSFISFDAVPVYDLPWDSLDLDYFIERYGKITGRRLNRERLQNLGLIHEERDRILATRAGVLLSDFKTRKRFFPFAKIECARFKGTEPGIFIDQMTVTDAIFEATEACMSFIKRNIALSSEIGEVYRKDIWEYPLEAIREAVNNAVIHRDYSILGSDIKIAIYDDMLEITSPGPLPDVISLETLDSGRSEIRNRILAPIFKDMGLIEAWGTGIPKMRREAKKSSDIDLVFMEPGHVFQVQFRKRSVFEGGNAPGGSQESVISEPGKADPNGAPALSKPDPDCASALSKAESDCAPALSKTELNGSPAASKSEPDCAPALSKSESDGAPASSKAESNGAPALGKVEPGGAPASSKKKAASGFVLSNVQVLVLRQCRNPLSMVELLKKVNRSDRTKFKRRFLSSLIEGGLIAMTEPTSPNSPKQKYCTTKKGSELLNLKETMA